VQLVVDAVSVSVCKHAEWMIHPTEHRQAAPQISNLFNQSHKHTTVTESAHTSVDTLAIRPLQVLLCLLISQMHQCTQFPQPQNPTHHHMLQSQPSASPTKFAVQTRTTHTPRRRGGKQQPSHNAVWPVNKGLGLLSQHAMHGTRRGACGQIADPLCKGTVR
jgi:hypothetical protein